MNDDMLRRLELWDDAAEDFCAEICKYEPNDFPPEAIARLQELADASNAHRRQVVRELRKMVSDLRRIAAQCDELMNRPNPHVAQPVEAGIVSRIFEALFGR
jgi:hypothetical protein